MIDLNLDDKVELHEFLEQVNYALSLEFKEKWRHRFSENFITLFQNKLIGSLNTQKPLKISVLETFLIKKHKYSASVVKDFMSCIDISLYYPLIYRDRSVR